MNPYEKMQGKATGHYVPVEVTRPDGSTYRTMAKLSNKFIEKLKEEKK